jgi:signal transduction histidine kinase
MASVGTPLDTSEGVVDLAAIEAAASLDAEAVAMAAHEIVGALTPLQGWLSMLATGALEGDADVRREAIAVMKGAAGRLEWLSRDLLDLAALDAGGLRVEQGAVDVTVSVREALKEFAGTAPDRSFEISVPDRALAAADPLRIAQVLMNLLSNADHHAPPRHTDQGRRELDRVLDRGLDQRRRARRRRVGSPPDLPAVRPGKERDP